jgi:hypothetical protein
MSRHPPFLFLWTFLIWDDLRVMVKLERPHKVTHCDNIIITFFSSSDNVYVHTSYANTEYGEEWKMQESNSSRDKRFSFVRNVQFGSGAYPAHLMGIMDSLPGKPSPGVRVTTHLDLVQRWRLNIALPRLPWCVSMVHTGTTLPFSTRHPSYNASERGEIPVFREDEPVVFFIISQALKRESVAQSCSVTQGKWSVRVWEMLAVEHRQYICNTFVKYAFWKRKMPNFFVENTQSRQCRVEEQYTK